MLTLARPSARPEAAPAPAGPLRAIRRLGLEHAPLAVLLVAYTIARVVMWRGLGVEALAMRGGSGGVFPVGLVVAGGMVFAVYHLCRVTLWDVETGGFLRRETHRAFRREYLTAERLAGAVLVLALYMATWVHYAAFKRAIPLIHPFGTWDLRLAEWDRALHFGVDPWRIVHPVLGHPAATQLVQAVYSAGWFGGMFGAVVVVGFAGDRALRLRFFLTLFLCWTVLGTLLATLMSSAGPAFFGAITGRADFQPQMDYLAAVAAQSGLGTLNVQKVLWTGYSQSSPDALGISAMPSMHVAVAALLATVGWHLHRVAGLLLTAFAAVILLGSVHLGWHYALDGYLSIASVPVIWWAAGRFVEWYGSRTGAFDLPGRRRSPA